MADKLPESLPPLTVERLQAIVDDVQRRFVTLAMLSDEVERELFEHALQNAAAQELSRQETAKQLLQLHRVMTQKAVSAAAVTAIQIAMSRPPPGTPGRPPPGSLS